MDYHEQQHWIGTEVRFGMTRGTWWLTWTCEYGNDDLLKRTFVGDLQSQCGQKAWASMRKFVELLRLYRGSGEPLLDKKTTVGPARQQSMLHKSHWSLNNISAPPFQRKKNDLLDKSTAVLFACVRLNLSRCSAGSCHRVSPPLRLRHIRPFGQC